MSVWTGAGWGVFVAACVAAWLLGRPTARRRCPRCGYNMAGLAGRRCPECGHSGTKERDLYRRGRWGWRLLIVGVGVLAGSLLACVPRIKDEGWRGGVPTFALIALFEPREPWDARSGWKDAWGELLANRAEYGYEEWWGWERQWYYGRMIGEWEREGEPLVSGPVLVPADGEVFGSVRVPMRMWPASDVSISVRGDEQRFSLDRNSGFVFHAGRASPGEQSFDVQVVILAGETVLWRGERTVHCNVAGSMSEVVGMTDNAHVAEWLSEDFWIIGDGLYIRQPWENANNLRVYLATRLEFLRNGIPVARAYYDFGFGKPEPRSPIREGGLNACMRWFGCEPFTEVPEDGARWTWRLTGDPAFAAVCVPRDSGVVECWVGSVEGDFRSLQE